MQRIIAILIIFCFCSVNFNLELISGNNQAMHSTFSLRPLAAKQTGIGAALDLSEKIRLVNEAWIAVLTAEASLEPIESYQKKYEELGIALDGFVSCLTQFSPEVIESMKEYPFREITEIMKKLPQDKIIFVEISTRLETKKDRLAYTHDTISRFRKKTKSKLKGEIKKIEGILFAMRGFAMCFYKNLGMMDEAGLLEKNFTYATRRDYGLDRYLGQPNAFHLSDRDIEALELFQGVEVYKRLSRTITIFGDYRLRYLFTSPFIDPEEILRRQKAIEAVMGMRKTIEMALKIEDEYSTTSYCKRPLNGIEQCSLLFLINPRHLPFGYYPPGLLKKIKGLCFPQRHPDNYDRIVYENIDESKHYFTDPAELQLIPFLSFLKCINELKNTLLNTGSQRIREIGRAFADVESVENIIDMLEELKQIRNEGKITRKNFIRRFEIGVEVNRFLQSQRLRLALAMYALGELDAYFSFATLFIEQGYSKVEIKKGGAPKLTIIDGHHPYLYHVNRQESKPVTIIFKPGENIAVVTGPQEAGKSTLSQTIALNTLLAQIAGWAPAKMRLTPLIFSIAVDPQGELKKGISHAKAQLIWGKELLGIIEKCKKRNVPLIYIADEVFCGVNSYEKVGIQAAYLIYLAKIENLFAIFTTQDLDLTEKLQLLSESIEPARNIRFYHFEGKDAQTGQYPHILLPEPATSADMNALDIMRELGYPPAITSLAETVIQGQSPIVSPSESQAIEHKQDTADLIEQAA